MDEEGAGMEPWDGSAAGMELRVLLVFWHFERRKESDVESQHRSKRKGGT